MFKYDWSLKPLLIDLNTFWKTFSKYSRDQNNKKRTVMNHDEFFFGMVDQAKGLQPYLQPGPLAEGLVIAIIRSSHRRCSIKKATLKNFWRDFNTAVFLWILQKILRTPILKNICERLLLNLSTWIRNYAEH